jgi:hypothetical protein
MYDVKVIKAYNNLACRGGNPNLAKTGHETIFEA